MGGFGGGFLQGFTGAVQKKIDQKQAEDTKLKDEKRQMYWKIAYDTTGAYSDAQKQSAQQELNKLLSPDAKKANQKFGDIFGKLTKQGQQQQGAQPSPAAQASLAQPKTAAPGASTDDPGAPGAVLSQPQTPKPQSAQGPQPSPNSGINAQPKTPAPQPSSGLPPVETDAGRNERMDAQAKADEDRKLAQTEREYKFWLDKGKEVLGKDANPRDLAEYAGNQGKKLPPIAVVRMKPVTIDMKDGKTGVAAMVGNDGKYYNLNGEAIEGDSIKGESPRQSSAMPRFDSHFITLEQAKEEQEKLGAKFTGIDGNEIKLADVPAGMVLQPTVSGGKFQFMPVTEEFAKVIADNLVKIVGKQHEADVAKGGGVVAGASRVPTVRETTPEGIGGTKSVATPVTGPQGGQAPKPQTAPPPTNEQTPAAQPQQAPGPQPSPKAQAALPQPKTAAPQSQAGNQADAGDPILPGMSTAQFSAAAARAAPVASAVTEIFGDPRQPDLHPLQSYAKLADNPKSQERIGKAIQLTLNGFGDGLKEAAIGAGVGPVHVSAGGWGTWLDNKLGGPQAAAGSQAATLRKVIGEMTPQEKDAYDSTMATMSTMAGLRSISRQSAAIGSLQLIERELPKIGLNATNSRQFYDQLQRTAGAISTFANTPGLFPRVKQGGQVIRTGFTPEMQKRITELTSEMEKKKAQGGKPSPKAQKALAPPAPKTADQYLQSIGAR